MLTMAPTTIMIIGDIDAGYERQQPCVAGLLSELAPGVTRRRGYERNEKYRDGDACPIGS